MKSRLNVRLVMIFILRSSESALISEAEKLF